ncbi:MAG: glycosyltransferase family 2 protein [Deltaproteobacteria bacterium]|nr:glycosyltransferase family 2 protein [Deltaproteobacteria bacterium]
MGNAQIRQQDRTMRQPVVSVVIPTYNRPSQLARCLDGLAELAYPQNYFEVIVVDDGGSLDLTPATARHRNQLNLTLLRQPRGGPGAARNTGAAVAQGDLIAFLDDDCRPAQDWLLRLTTCFSLETEQRSARLPNRLIGGPIFNALPHNP